MSLPPHFYVAATCICVSLSLLLFLTGKYPEELFLLPPVLLVIFYAAMNFARQRKGLSEFHIQSNQPLKWLFKRAMARYIVWFVLILLAAGFYNTVVYYSSDYFQSNHVFFKQLIYGFLILGIPYFMITLVYKASRKEDFFDPAIRLIFMARSLVRCLKQGKRFSSVVRNSYNKKVLLNFVVRLYFIPIIVIQILFTLEYIQQQLFEENNYTRFFTYIYLFIAFLWLLDICNTTVAYCLESRWLENRARSVDTRATGWVVCFCCYEPLNGVTGYLFPWAPSVSTDYHGDMLVFNYWFLVAIKSLETLVLTAHVYTTVSLGPSIANISFRNLQTRGLYRYIRHPGVTTKCLYWFLQSVFYKNFWSLKFIFGYTMWTIIYVLRAITEERHLRKYAVYRNYMDKVKHRFFPGLF